MLRSTEKYSGLLGPLTQLAHGGRTRRGFDELGAALKRRHQVKA